jgi:flagellar basal body-associated protein FliL
MEEEKTKTIGKRILTIIITVIITLIVIVCIIFAWVLIKNPLNVRGIILYKIGWISEPVKLIPNTNTDKAPTTNTVPNETDTAPTTPSTR